MEGKPLFNTRDYSKIGLKSSTIASSFGKVFKTPAAERKNAFKQEDIAISLLYLVSNNIGQIAFLNAQAHGIQRIYFSGFFIRGHPMTMNTLSYAISYWSKGKIKALFLRHEGYLGAVGAFLRDAPAQAQGSFEENFSVSRKISISSIGAVGSLETSASDLVAFPLLKGVYNADTFILDDTETQAYWIDLLDLNVGHLVPMAISETKRSIPDFKQRIDSFATMFRQHLKLLRNEPKAYGIMTVRRYTYFNFKPFESSRTVLA